MQTDQTRNTETVVFYPKTSLDWHAWLKANHETVSAVWLVQHHKKSEKESITWSEAVDSALCFGWIDSKKIRIDEETTHQFFTKRKPKGTWSKINKEKVEKLIAAGLMEEAGYLSIETAKANGSWTLLDDVEELVLPGDLQHALRALEGAEAYYHSLSKSAKKMILAWLVLAKRPETRQKRIAEVAEAASKGQKPAHMH